MNKIPTRCLAILLTSALFSPAFSQIPCFQKTCPPPELDICDQTDNDPGLWHYIEWWDPAAKTQNLADAEVDPALVVETTCADPLSVSFELLLDLDGDGTPETRIASDNLADIPAAYVPYNNYPDPAQLAWRVFDLRNVTAAENYRFGLQTSVDGNVHTYRIGWNTGQAPDTWATLQLPYGKHRLVWTISDPDGNQETCSTEINIHDCGKPTLTCLNGLSVNLMPTRMIRLWANDFLQSAGDNYTTLNALAFGVRKAGTGSGFPLDSAGMTNQAVTYDCSEIGQHFVEVWVRDAAGNTDFCTAPLSVMDNSQFCSSYTKILAICTDYCGENFPLKPEFELSGNHPALPPGTLFGLNDSINDAGCRLFNRMGIPLAGDYTLALGKDNDPLNGLSTYDLSLIEQYLAGDPDAIDSPFKLIAADANNSRSVSADDLVELRKLLLGIYDELPNNTSWRFVPADYIFPDSLNPFTSVFPETVQLNFATDSVRFTSIKIGDVSCSALPQDTLPQTETLAKGSNFCLGIENRLLAAGETVLVPFTADSSGALLGLQFELNVAQPVNLLEVVPGPKLDSSNFALLNGHLACSWSSAAAVNFQTGELLFYLKILASEIIAVDAVLDFKLNRLRAESYTPDKNYRPLELCFSPSNSVSGLDKTTLIQLAPNPATGNTWLRISPDLNGPLQWHFFDFTGRVLASGSGSVQGGQQLEIPAGQFQAGIYGYRVQVGRFVYWGKLVKL
ncbi:MAG: hypothetical protein KDD14_06725 [Saprospiraceae bacterium]|nr:hypothetical protein [Saprospiraceae bacterium]